MGFDLPDIWTLSGVGLALLAIGPAMTSVPGPGHWEFRISRICFVGAALLFFAKLAFWGAEDLSPIRLGIVGAIGAAIAIALAFAIQWVNRKEAPPKDAKLQPAAILFEWKWAKLPTKMPTSGTFISMRIASMSDGAGHPLFLSPMPGEPGDPLKFGNRKYASVYRGEITNYADFPVFNLAMNFKTEFYSFEKDPDNPNVSHRAKAPVDSYDRPVIINKLDSKETYAFYAYSDSRLHTQVSMPQEITYLRSTNGEREKAVLIPPMEPTVSFFPVEIVETKSPPEPPPQALGPPNTPEKK